MSWTFILVHKMVRTLYRFIIPINIVLFLTLLAASQQVQAQWPPFRFSLTPTHENRQITYRIQFSSRVDWSMSDVTIKILLPEGTRFLEASAASTTEANFDGKEITFFTSVFHRPIRNAFFTVEVTDPAKTDFTTHAWITWKGDQPGDYLTKDVSIDVTRQSLNWDRPSYTPLQLTILAKTTDDVLTYNIYPTNTNWRRMWDLKVHMAIPEETTFLGAQAPPPFVANFDGKEATFSIVELERAKEVDPLSFMVSTKAVTEPFLVNHVWASWKNVGGGVGQTVAPQEDTRSGDIIVQPNLSQHVISDPIGDVPFSNYDLTSVSLLEEKDDLRVNFYTAGDLESIGEPLEYLMFIDQDCQRDTGAPKLNLGAEYMVKYNHNSGRADIKPWDEENRVWRGVESVELNSLADGRMIAVWLPYALVKNHRQFCWSSLADYVTNAFTPSPPTDRVPDSNNPILTKFEATGLARTFNPEASASSSPPVVAMPTPLISPTSTLKEEYLIKVGEDWRYLKGYREASYPVTAWREIGHNDTNWLNGSTGIGYGDGDNVTVLDDMRQNYVSVFLRHKFDVPNPGLVQSLILEIDFDDGFVAYLNGTEVARRNVNSAPNSVAFDSLAESNHEAGAPETIDITAFIDHLLPGQNVIAIQGHNENKNSADFSVTPALHWKYLVKPVDSELNSGVIISNAREEELELTPSIPIYYGNDRAIPIFSESSEITDIVGKLAIPVDNGQVAYDVHIYSLPDGQELARIPNARQPNFRVDGQRILINREGGGTENIYEYDLNSLAEQQVSDAPRDSHPFYDPWGNRVVYGNSELTVGSAVPRRDDTGEVIRDQNDNVVYSKPRQPFIFVQCGLLPPHLETEPRCRDIPGLGILIPAGQIGEIQGTQPVWTANDMIAYRGCNTWAGSRLCGIYIVPSASTKGFSNGFIPIQLTQYPDDTPADTKGDLIAFSSRRDGNWEAYMMDLNGSGVKNLSNSPISNDGLPTISPDGNWVAFVSDRDGQWAVWVVPVTGGQARRLFDLPANIPWGNNDRAWINERISWGP